MMTRSTLEYVFREFARARGWRLLGERDLLVYPNRDVFYAPVVLPGDEHHRRFEIDGEILLIEDRGRFCDRLSDEMDAFEAARREEERRQKQWSPYPIGALT